MAIVGFSGQVDYFGLTEFQCTGSDASLDVVDIPFVNADGVEIARTVEVVSAMISANYRAKCGSGTQAIPGIGSAHSVAAADLPAGASALGTAPYNAYVSGVNIKTSLGSLPEVDVSARVLKNASGDCENAAWDAFIANFGVVATARPQLLDSCATIGGTGCALQDASYSMTADEILDENGLSVDFNGGRVEVQLTIRQSSSTNPTCTAGSGYAITAPLSVSAKLHDYTEWSVTLSKPLARAS